MNEAQLPETTAAGVRPLPPPAEIKALRPLLYMGISHLCVHVPRRTHAQETGTTIPYLPKAFSRANEDWPPALVSARRNDTAPPCGESASPAKPNFPETPRRSRHAVARSNFKGGVAQHGRRHSTLCPPRRLLMATACLRFDFDPQQRSPLNAPDRAQVKPNVCGHSLPRPCAESNRIIDSL